MKEIKAITIATVITAMIMLACACIMPAVADTERDDDYYLRLAVVVKTEWICDNLRVITCIDEDGNMRDFYDDDAEWAVGDIANLFMWNAGEEEEDDEIVEIFWKGYTEDISKWMQENGWR